MAALGMPQEPNSNSATTPRDHQGNFQAAVARTLSRSLALYFSRPVRLFRPPKVTGWHSLRGLAMQNGITFSPKYVFELIKTHGFVIVPKHFIPPMAVNAMLGTILWGTYAETFIVLESRWRNYSILNAGLAGGVAGGFQALLAAPAENARILLEGGSGGSSWSNAWKEVFQGTKSKSISRQKDIEDIRQIRGWMRDVGDMAGRGWNGWAWGFGKDICGFAAFFSIFETTRRIALQVRDISYSYFSKPDELGQRRNDIQHQLPRIAYGLTLISGGVIAGLAYETISRPWDVARRTARLDGITHPFRTRRSLMGIIIQKAREDGIRSFFHPWHSRPREDTQLQSGPRKRVYSVLRTLGRVGPWGVGFLVWETYGQELP